MITLVVRGVVVVYFSLGVMEVFAKCDILH